MARKIKLIGMDTKLPFHVFIPSMDDTLTFKNYGAVLDWAKKQQDRWATTQELNAHHGQASDLAWKAINNFFNQIQTQANTAGNPKLSDDGHWVAHESLCVFLNQLQKGLFAPAESPVGERIFDDMGSVPEAAAARLIWAAGNPLGGGQAFSADTVKALIEVHVEDMAGFNEPRVQKAQLTNMRSVWTDTFAHTEDWAVDRIQFGIRLGGKAVRRLYRTSQAHAKEMKRIEETFKEEMRLRAPADYWTTRATNSHKGADGAFRSFVGVSVLTIVVLAISWNGIIKLVSAMGAGFNLGSAIVLTLPAVLLLWILRLISRRYVTALATARDAEHRETLIRTYLALMAEEGSGVTEQDRLLILQALFRPENAAADDDAPPPHLLEIMAKAAGIKKSG